jgi:peptidyl-prolyl cis-trans isomerase B (cyclophilin B)
MYRFFGEYATMAERNGARSAREDVSEFVTGGSISIMANRIATLNTSKGVIKFELFEDLAPITTKNFIDLAERKFYDGLIFHRYVPGFVIQGGDPTGNGTGGSGRTIQLEVTPQLKHDAAGAVAMARTSDPDSATSQFYITLAPTPNLDMSYAVFGKVTEGLDNLMQLRQGDKMQTVTIGDA